MGVHPRSYNGSRLCAIINFFNSYTHLCIIIFNIARTKSHESICNIFFFFIWSSYHGNKLGLCQSPQLRGYAPGFGCNCYCLSECNFCSTTSHYPDGTCQARIFSIATNVNCVPGGTCFIRLVSRVVFNRLPMVINRILPNTIEPAFKLCSVTWHIRRDTCMCLLLRWGWIPFHIFICKPNKS